MTKSNEISQANPDHASRRGSWVLWASILSGVAAIAIMVVVLLTVYNTEKKYTVGVQTIAGLDAEITRLGERREALLGLVETSNDELAQLRIQAEQARPAAAALLNDAAARDAAVEGRNRAEADRSRIEAERMELAGEVDKLRKVRDDLREKIETLARSHDADARVAQVMVEGRKAAEASIADVQKRQAVALDRAKAAEEDALAKRRETESRRAELARISADLESNKIALAAEQDRIAKAKEKHFKIAAGIRDQQDLLVTLREQAAEDTAKVQRLRGEIEAFTENRNRLDAETASLKSALSWLEPRVSELGALQARSGEIRNAYASAQQQDRARVLELENSRTEAVTLQQQIATRREILSDLTAREAEARTALSSATEQAKNARQAQEKLREKLKAAKEDLVTLQRQLDTTQAERSVILGNVAELTVSRDTLQRTVVELQKQVNELEAKKKLASDTATTRVE